MKNIIELAEQHGFEPWHTGGGCYAYMRDMGKTTILVTNLDGVDLPMLSDQVVMVGIFDNDSWEQQVSDEQSLDEFDAFMKEAGEQQ